MDSAAIKDAYLAGFSDRTKLVKTAGRDARGVQDGTGPYAGSSRGGKGMQGRMQGRRRPRIDDLKRIIMEMQQGQAKPGADAGK